MDGWVREFICDGFGNTEAAVREAAVRTRGKRDSMSSKENETLRKEDERRYKKNFISIIAFCAAIVLIIIIGLCFV